MREIKFRTWDIKDKIMCYPECFIFNQDWSYDTNWSAWKNIKSDDRTFVTSQRQGKLMQYTGLKDKNGTEIYEGDIVEWEYLGFHISEIKQDLIGYYVENTGHIKDVIEKFRFDFAFKNLNVIGNIYENPELLDK